MLSPAIPVAAAPAPLHTIGYGETLGWWLRLVRDPLASFTDLVTKHRGAARLPLGRAGLYLLSGSEHVEQVLHVRGDSYTDWFASPAALERTWRPTGFVPEIAGATSWVTGTWWDGRIVDLAAELRRVTLDIRRRTALRPGPAADAALIGRAYAELRRRP
ncbi:hypothetical protein ACW9HQ_39005, partial [Nocardia gipuzkoensis]